MHSKRIMVRKNYRVFHSVWIVIVGLIVLQSCTKNELVEYERQAKNKILTFKVTNSAQALSGAIDQEANTIKLYIPYYSNLDFLIAEIKLDEGASLLRSDSTEINLLEDELDPIPVGDTVAYIVRSEDGKFRRYTLTQEILPHSAPLAVLGYGNDARQTAFGFKMHTKMDEPYVINANRVFYAFGNFLSSSRLGKFTLTNRQTGEVHSDYVHIVSVSPQAEDMYVMTARISAEAKFGTYDVTLEHQGRTTVLPPIEVIYQLPAAENYSSSAAYAIGDTIVFQSDNATFSKPERLYIRVDKSTRAGDVPVNFPENLYGQEINMELVSANKTTIKAIFPSMPTGIYRNYLYNAINLYAIFTAEEGYAADTAFGVETKIGIPTSGGFNVLPSK